MSEDSPMGQFWKEWFDGYITLADGTQQPKMPQEVTLTSAKSTGRRFAAVQAITLHCLQQIKDGVPPVVMCKDQNEVEVAKKYLSGVFAELGLNAEQVVFRVMGNPEELRRDL